MSIDELRIIFKKETSRNGYQLEERKSTSSDSSYFVICTGNGPHTKDNSLQFRVSNHKTKSNVITLRLDQKLTPKSAEGFIKNRCKDLGDRRLRSFFKM